MKTFKDGGVHPPEMKGLSASARLERIDTPSRVCLPMLQHTGSPAKLIVAVGDTVNKGQMIAEATGFVSVPIHASISGKVTAIEAQATALGRTCEQVTIESDGKNQWAPGCNEHRDWRKLDVGRIKELIRDAGIVGMGGAAFPTHVKLSPPENRPIDTAILNGAECEPYLTCDYRLMLERTKGILEGFRIIMRVLGVRRAFIGVEENKRDAFEHMRDACWADEAIEARLLKVKYPQGAEKNLIQALTGREVPPGKLPLDVGVVVHNVATAYAIYETVTSGIPLIERVVSVTGDAVLRPANLIVSIGTSVGFLLERQGVDPGIRKVILGGPMMGIAVPTADLPVVKGTSGILALKDISKFEPGPCIRCGRCVQACPLRGMPAEMVSAIEMDDINSYERLHVMDCVECGACTFACPAHRPIIHHIKRAKAEVAALRAKKKS